MNEVCRRKSLIRLNCESTIALEKWTKEEINLKDKHQQSDVVKKEGKLLIWKVFF